MGWDYDFTLDYPDWSSNSEILIEIVQAMFDSSAFTFKNMAVYRYDLVKAHNGNLKKAKVAFFDTVNISPIPTLIDWINEFTESGVLFDIVFLVKRVITAQEHVNREIHLYAFDDQFLTYPGGLPTGLTYDAHSSKLYSSVLNTSYENNLSLLLTELDVLANVGIITIRGFGIEQETDVRSHHLCFHQNIQDFILDLRKLYGISSSKVKFTFDDFRLVIDAIAITYSDDPLLGFIVDIIRGD